MFINTLASEWTKLRTTRSFWWTTALFVLMSVGWAGVMGYTAMEADGGFPTIWASSIATAVYLLGFCVLMIQAIMIITTEYRYQVQSVTYLATPRRWTVALAKLLLYAAIAAILTFVVVVAGFLLADALAPASAAALFEPFKDESALLIMWTFPTAAAALVVFSQGMALLLRQTAGTVALMLVWFMGLESIVRLIPNWGNDIARFLPFENLNAFVMNTPVQDAPWGVHGSGVYFFAWAVVLWVLGVIALQRRDA